MEQLLGLDGVDNSVIEGYIYEEKLKGQKLKDKIFHYCKNTTRLRKCRRRYWCDLSSNNDNQGQGESNTHGSHFTRDDGEGHAV